MPRGGTTKATWKKGEKPPVKRPKGSKNKKTILKESIGLKNWEGLEKFIKEDGATKLVKEMKKLTGRNYAIAFQAMAEFVQPKLSRQELDAKLKADIKISDRPIVFK